MTVIHHDSVVITLPTGSPGEYLEQLRNALITVLQSQDKHLIVHESQWQVLELVKHLNVSEKPP
jgi:hypothetical protein